MTGHGAGLIARCHGDTSTGGNYWLYALLNIPNLVRLSPKIVVYRYITMRNESDVSKGDSTAHLDGAERGGAEPLGLSFAEPTPKRLPAEQEPEQIP